MHHMNLEQCNLVITKYLLAKICFILKYEKLINLCQTVNGLNAVELY